MIRRRIPISRGVVALTVMILMSACGSPDDQPQVITGPTMGTSYTVKFVGREIPVLSGEIERELIALNQVFSTYDASSEISAVNNAPPNELLEVSDELMAVLETSKAINELSDGAFDVTVGPLVNLWGFGPDGPKDGVPEQTAILDARTRVGTAHLQLEGNSLEKTADVYIDLSAIAKGYAVDAVAALLEEKNIDRYLVEIGGEIKARGRNQRGTHWVLAIEAPDVTSRRIFRTLPVENLAMATSGDYRNFFEVAGKRYSHTIDPRTGWPVAHNLASVTVLHESAEFADGLATAFSVLGIEDAMRIAEERNLMVLAIIRNGDNFSEVASTHMQEYLNRSQP